MSERVVTWESNTTNDYNGLFGQLVIGKGREEFERGCRMLSKYEYNWLNYRQAVKALRERCEV